MDGGELSQSYPSRAERAYSRSQTISGATSDVEAGVTRTRALQATEYYLHNIRASGDSDRIPPGGRPCAPEAPAGMTDMDSSAETEDALRAGVTPASSDAYYKAKLRAGFIDLRNSYNEKIRPRTNTFPHNRQLGGGGPPPRELPRVVERINANSGGPEPASAVPKSLVGRRELYRSNSSLELDRLDNGAEKREMGSLHRDYGSASSLDMVGSNNGESFFAMLQDFRNENLDQRAPPPPQIQEVLRGKVDYPPNKQMLSPNGKVPNGSIPGEDMGDGSHSPKLKSKKSKERKHRNKSVVGESSSGGIFKKFRGAKTDTSDPSNTKVSEGSGEGDPKMEERQKRKALVHYDCQSIGMNLSDVIRRKNSLNRRRNTKTGASAASAGPGQRTEDSHQAMSEDDDGDGKSNDLVLSCPYFRNEVGGEDERMISLNRTTAQKRVQNLLGSVGCGDTTGLMRRPACNGVAILDNSPSPTGTMPPPLLAYKGLVVEHVDHGAFYYRHFFHNYEHQNVFGLDDNIGPVAVSVKREKLGDQDSVGGRSEPVQGGLFQYRVIVRTSELQTLRGCILEEAVPCSSRLSSSRGLPAKDVLEYVVPELQMGCLKAAITGNRTEEQLMMLDEQGLTQNYKIGVMYCRAGQATEEEMYNNEHAGSIFEEFLDCIGQRVRLKGFEKYRGGLDSKTDSTGTHSLFTTFHNYEIMFHVSTFLPYTASNRQQLLRKRHIGNDIVTIVFQEPGALPFTPRSVRSHFQHVFLIVRAHRLDGDQIKYSMAVTRSKDVPPFGPPIPDGPLFTPSTEFAEFLLTKAINAENAAHKSEKFTVMATRTRMEYLKDLATNFVTTSALDSGSKLSKFSLGSGRKKEKPKNCQIPDIWARGALVWNMEVEDFGSSCSVACYLGVAADTLVVVEAEPHHVLFTLPCRAVIGWTAQGDSIRLYYDHGECVALRVSSGAAEEVQEIVDRLCMVTKGCETVEMTLRRNGLGQLGFHLHYEAIVADVEPHGFAWQTGLRQGSRLVEICKVATATLTHDQMIDLLRTSVTVKVIVIPPFEDGSPRRGCEDLGSSHSSLSSPHTPSVERLLVEDEGITQASSRSLHTAAKHIARPEPQGMAMLPNHNHRTHFAESQTDRRTEQSDSQHDKQPSRDSTGSRSSGHGSMEGHSSENRTSRLDNLSSEGFISGDERHARHNYKDVSEGARSDWSSRSNNYAPYGRETGYSPPSPRQHHGEWNYEHVSDSEHRGNYPGSSSSVFMSRTANLPQTSKAVPTSSAGYPSHAEDRSAGGLSASYGVDHGKWDIQAVSTSNLSQNSDPSSSNSSSLLRPSPRRQHGGESQRDERRPVSAQVSKSPSMRRPQLGSIGPQQRRSYLDGSPISSNNSSPKAHRRGQQGSSAESLNTRLRPGVSTAINLSSSHGSNSSKDPSSGIHSKLNTNFQEELMRLIDPDVSLAELESSLNKRSALKRLPSRPPRLHRTLSDESLCSTQPNKSQHGTELLSNDVLFSGAAAKKLSASRENVSREHRGQPPDGSEKSAEHSIGGSSGLASSSPLLPLPDAAVGLDWSNLLEAATKAFDDPDKHGRHGESGMNEKGRLIGLRLSKSSDSPPRSSAQPDHVYQNLPARPPPSALDRLSQKQRYGSQEKLNQNASERLQYLRDKERLTHGSQERLHYKPQDYSSHFKDRPHYGSQERLPHNHQERLGHGREQRGFAGSQERLNHSPRDQDYGSQERLNERYYEEDARERLNFGSPDHGRHDRQQLGSSDRLQQPAAMRQGSLERGIRSGLQGEGAVGDSQAPGSVSGSSTGNSPTQRWQELESQLSRLEDQLGQERQQRLTLEARVQQLTLDNVRLQEESTTAAQQLRRFTEWFFNTIDRQ